MVTEYKITDTKRGKSAFECLDCDRISIYKTETSDGLICPHCKSKYFVFIGYVEGIKIRRDDDDKEPKK